ncbi:hypothetical protein FQZ97_966220 [compost metagenome]
MKHCAKQDFPPQNWMVQMNIGLLDRTSIFPEEMLLVLPMNRSFLTTLIDGFKRKFPTTLTNSQKISGGYGIGRKNPHQPINREVISLNLQKIKN